MTKNVLAFTAVAALIGFIMPAAAHTGTAERSLTVGKSAAIDTPRDMAVEFARRGRGADDPAGDDRGGRGRGSDDPAGHASIKSFDTLLQLARRGRGADDPAGDTRRGRGKDDPVGHG